MVFKISSSPYTHDSPSTSRMMFWVIAACVPGTLALWYWFGWGSLVQVVLGMLSAIVAEAAVVKLRRQPLNSRLKDNSALLTGLLLGVSIPPLAPWWLVVVGTLFAVVIAKQLYGGLGQNPFNPAMTGYVVLLIAFPVPMTAWLPSYSLAATPPGFADTLHMIAMGTTAIGQSISELQLGIDGVSQATPLDGFKTGLHNGTPASTLLQLPVFTGILAGLGWQWVNLAFLAGGIFLLWRGIIRWHIPVSFLLALAVCSSLGWFFAPEKCLSPMMQLFSGATMLGAFFILTDPVTASTTNRGRLIFGALAGVLVWLIRTFGGYPDGVAFATLLANITVPLIDYYTRPRVYGHR